MLPNRLDVQSFDVHPVQGPHFFRGFVFPFGILFGAVVSECHEDVDILKNLARRDADDAVKRFDEIIAAAAAVLAAEGIGKAERGTELFGFDQEACAIGLPFRRFHWRVTRLDIFVFR